MSARAKFRAGKGGPKLDRKMWGVIAGVIVGSFVLGYAITAVSFSQGRGIDVTTVPDVRNLAVDAARRQMARADLDLVLADSFPNPTIPAGAILAQSPLPGQEVSPGSQVQVFVSSGPLRPEVPRVAGMPLDLATRALQTAGFDVLVEESEGEEERGRVLGTEPAAGSPVALPATVLLLISSGPPRFAMPAVIGMLESEARLTLEEMGLELGAIDYETRVLGEPGSVFAQEPSPGDSVHVGTAVRLRVNGLGPDDAFRDSDRQRRRDFDRPRRGPRPDRDADRDPDPDSDQDRQFDIGR